jgi:hypothetical protein
MKNRFVNTGTVFVFYLFAFQAITTTLSHQNHINL